MGASISVRTALGMLALLTLGVGSGCVSWPRETAERRETHRFSLGASGRVFLSTFNGKVEVAGEPGEEATIERIVRCRARTLSAAQAGLDLVEPEASCQGDRLSFTVRDPRAWGLSLSVELVARVPLDAELVLETSNGSIEVRAMRGAVSARTSNGRVSLEECAGRVEARSSNGAVRLACAPDGGRRGIVLATSNGAAECVLPADFQGELDAKTSNGVVRCDFPVRHASKGNRRTTLNCRVGSGGSTVRISTSNGAVRILRGQGSSAERIDEPEDDEEPGERRV